MPEDDGAYKLVLTSLGRVLPRLLDYLRPGFHPDDHDNYELATSYLAQIGRLEGWIARVVG